jgi:hypothetical protein
VKHPKLRVYIMHAGFPMIDEMLTTLYTYPQLHVDIAVLTYTQPPLRSFTAFCDELWKPSSSSVSCGAPIRWCGPVLSSPAWQQSRKRIT